MQKIDFKSLSLEEMKQLFLKIGEKEYRGEQTFNFIHKNMVDSISKITVLPKDTRDKLEKNYTIGNISVLERYDSKIDDTKKYLFLLEDGNIIESVAMKYSYGTSACISTQVGCKMGCVFCASTKEGLVRNLTSSEILSEVYNIQKDLNLKLSNIVLMGSGEPLDNYDNVINFLKLLHDEKGQNFGYRNITLSTCGLVPKIYKLADEKIPITLSISLHSPFDEDRKRMMPIGKKYRVEEILKACYYYVEKTNRRITFEYTLINGENDRREDLEELARILGGLLCHVNLICLNPIEEFNKTKAKEDKIQEFKNRLNQKGISTTIRREMGSDINAACGQLRRKYIKGL
ncbi:23S rRNA (adenine(2503)-C(2))-methyltransferase RlmN [Anaerosalibacter massiliensis]|uniref:Probable dual-specificity RNA methyltransferase RlmN n=1 Tax=Anaerosalibacter massiliensis TaxID=1347392 RepID=A0A9X2MEE0_9FIRM|nr:23S rRNA (adenine(2503)-C(2))-methyltransferase RlmN [Anaerosalibacter massiliensis]MCR2042573.1 23S rRNA (adenine(2503)-C(2))-methyltransferase RlmN [Anaerosalibacter massiliensis]